MWQRLSPAGPPGALALHLRGAPLQQKQREEGQGQEQSRAIPQRGEDTNHAAHSSEEEEQEHKPSAPQRSLAGDTTQRLSGGAV
ncbi:unnamed protein product [Boreogadus saida]